LIIFLDTNVLASALATRGLCADLFQVVIKWHRLVICREVLDELERILPRSFRLPSDLTRQYLAFLDSIAEISTTTRAPTVPIPDPDDTPIVAAALAADAALFVTGDKALLGLGQVDGMPIVPPRTCWETLAKDNAAAR